MFKMNGIEDESLNREIQDVLMKRKEKKILEEEIESIQKEISSLFGKSVKDIEELTQVAIEKINSIKPE